MYVYQYSKPFWSSQKCYEIDVDKFVDLLSKYLLDVDQRAKENGYDSGNYIIDIDLGDIKHGLESHAEIEYEYLRWDENIGAYLPKKSGTDFEIIFDSELEALEFAKRIKQMFKNLKQKGLNVIVIEKSGSFIRYGIYID